ncbi:AraC family transcriptional regulator [Chryseobacterium sp. Chry.R1]|uniref:helix-turn-helix transcriptional regulator n=1 Tax=Chryseobacterium sp. Chry.R1 TaxID=3139392 RepID=UPI0031F91780
MKTIKEVREKVDAHPASILMIRQQWEQRLPMHRHQKGQLLLVIGGMAKLRTKEKDLYIPRSHYIWMPKMYSHNLMFNSKDLDIINIYFPEEEKFNHPFYDDLGIYPVSNLLSELLNFGKDWNGDFFPDSWEYEFLLTMKHLLPKENLKKFSIQLPTTNDERLTAIIKFVRNNLENPLTLEEVGGKFGFSVRSLTRIFTNKLGISFIQYVKMVRIIRAMELLKDTTLSMSEIAYEIGYSNISAFSNTFQQLTNMRPTEFKSML